MLRNSEEVETDTKIKVYIQPTSCLIELELSFFSYLPNTGKEDPFWFFYISGMIYDNK